MSDDKAFEKTLKVVKKPTYGDVLIVDDESDICEVVKGYLETMDCFRHIIIANDGISAGLKIGLQKFVLILLDLNIPKRSGEDLLQMIHDKSEFNGLSSVVIMSGTVNERSFVNIRKLGVNKFLVKPFDGHKFVDFVKDFLKNKKHLK